MRASDELLETNEVAEAVDACLAPTVELQSGHDTLFQILADCGNSKADGEIVICSGTESGRIFYASGRIAWITASTEPQTFRQRLVARGFCDDAALQSVVEECKRNGWNFAETVIAWKLVDEPTLRTQLLQHVASALLEILRWPKLAAMFVPVKRTYSGHLTYTFKELLECAGRGEGLKREVPAAVLEEVRSWAVQCEFTRDTREHSMDIARIREVFEEFKRQMGDGLLASDIFGRADAQSIIGFNSNAAGCALFTRVSGFLEDSLKGANFPAIDRYVLIDLAGHKLVVLANVGPDFLWGILCDTSKMQLGMLTNVILAEAMPKLRQALTNERARPAAGVGAMQHNR